MEYVYKRGIWTFLEFINHVYFSMVHMFFMEDFLFLVIIIFTVHKRLHS